MTTPMPMMPFLLMELPSELFVHVLTRLPLKYLMRLRCVSKFFLDLTNNTDFITSYCKSNPPTFKKKRKKSNPPNKDFNFMDTTTTTSLVVASYSNEWQWQWQWPWPWRFHMLFKGSNFIYIQKRHELIPFHCPKAPNDEPLIISNKGLVPNDKRLINSINGLVCFGGGNNSSLEIYNIFAGTNYYLIPPVYTPATPLEIYNIFAGTNYYLTPPPATPPSYEPPNPIFVFGYDPISNDYKILRIGYYYYPWSMYSFATNSWKKMTFYQWDYYTVILNSEGGRYVCINGVIYWPPGGSSMNRNHDKIVMFDLYQEKFGVIELPKEDLLFPTQYRHIQLLSFRGCLAFAFIKKTSSTTTTTTRKRMRSGESGRVGGEKATSSSSSSDGVVVIGEIGVELFTMTDMNPSKTRKIYMALKKISIWSRQSFVVPIPAPTKQEDVEIVSCCDEIFLGWFESNQLRLYNLHTKHIFNLPLSTSPSHYYPKASFMEKKKKDNPTYVDNLSFDFSLI